MWARRRRGGDQNGTFPGRGAALFARFLCDFERKDPPKTPVLSPRTQNRKKPEKNRQKELDNCGEVWYSNKAVCGARREAEAKKSAGREKSC